MAETLKPCPFCKGDAETRKASQDIDGRWHAAACGCLNCGVFFYGDGSYGHNGFADPEDYEKSLMQAIERWNTRATHGTLTAEQVRKAVEGHGNIMDNRLYEDWQAVADELNAELGSGNADTDDALALLDEIREAGRISYDDYSQLFDAIAELGSGTCELVETDSYSNANEVIHVLECSECGETCEHVNGAYPRCPHCGRHCVHHG